MKKSEIKRAITQAERLEARAETAPPRSKLYLMKKAVKILQDAITQATN